ncbi:MAG: beta-ketoacyl-[acyl-carrier-protein] synthase family protein [Bacteroidales bacterium]|nr:beta-ketoacyl-[acyl-carrier-protein] synthase family protein [Bacteroidales bacterium]
MKETVYISGAGVISAIGVGKEETLSALLDKKSGVGDMKYLTSRHREIPVGEVKRSNAQLMQMAGIKENPLISRTVLMGVVALKEALSEAHLKSEDLSNVHFISSTIVGGMDIRELFFEKEIECDREHAMAAVHNCGTSTEEIASHVGPFASLSTVSTACSSATNALISAAFMIESNLADIVVAGGAECLSLFHLNGFNSLMILDSHPCRPFDKERAGLNLGEGAAYLVLESESSLKRRGVKPLCRLAGYGNACDAFHQTASSPTGEGAFLAMQKALEKAELAPKDIDYINAHGTATQNNDESESCAIKRLFKERIPEVSSTKSYTGHTTGASGAIEAVISLLALENQFLPASLNWKTPMEEGIIPVTDIHPKSEIKNIMSNAFGFGGNDSSIILSKV